MDYLLPTDLDYCQSHEWVKESEGIATIGITDFAQAQLGEIVFIELPEEQRIVKANQECAVIESIKAASDIYAPLSGTIIEINKQIENNTGLLNDDPYGNGWLFKIKLDTPDELNSLLNAQEYEMLIENN
ncbi:glycine cleavage system protein GcvH [Chlamydiota bacterium]